MFKLTKFQIQIIPQIRRSLSFSSVTTTILEPPSFSKSFPKHLPSDFQSLTVLDAWECAVDHKIIRFQLPSNVSNISALGVPSGIKIRQTINGETLDKSYSPVSHPDVPNVVDVLAKSYPFLQGGGLGQYLCNMKRGDFIDIKLKPEKLFQGVPYERNRWKEIVLIGNGTGVCPLYQLALSILTDTQDRTKISMISQHRTAQDIILKNEINEFEKIHPLQFKSYVLLSQKESSGDDDDLSVYGAGRIQLHNLMNTDIIPKPTLNNDTHAIVCGTDGFLNTVCGGHVRIDVPGQIKKKKQQGELLGLLNEVGWLKENVTKL